jgi:hypothetical protein
LACIRADVDVDESLTGWTLHEWTKKSRHGILAAGLYSNGEFEVQVFRFGSLLLDCLITTAPTFLQTEVHISRRFLQDDPKRQFAFHAFLNQNVNKEIAQYLLNHGARKTSLLNLHYPNLL